MPLLPTNSKTMVQQGKNIAYRLWLLSIVALMAAYIFFPEKFTVEYIISFVQSFKTEILVVYIAVSLIRGFFLIPSTIFVIAGSVLFPDQSILVLAISMIGVLFSATALYFFADSIGFSEILEEKYPQQVTSWKARLNRPGSTWFVLGWSFFPLVPTDIICYVAGIVKLPFRYMILGVFVGEAVLNIGYIYFGSNITNYFTV